MKAVRIHEPKGFEGIDGLVYEDAPDPQPAIGDALVRGARRQLHPDRADCGRSATDRAGHDRGPMIPAHEGSGVVVALGYGTAGVSVGDEVYGLIDGYRDGWAAEYVAIEVRSLAPKPTTVDFVEAAAIPQAALTSWQALFDHGHLESGQTVVIHGAGGGVGSMAVQLARWAGAHVIGTGRAERAPARARPRRRRIRRPRAGRLGDGRRPGRPGLRHHRRRRARPFAGDRQARWRPGVCHGAAARPIGTTSARFASSATRTAPSSARSPGSSTRARCGRKSARSTRSRRHARPSWPSRPSTFPARSC